MSSDCEGARIELTENAENPARKNGPGPEFIDGKRAPRGIHNHFDKPELKRYKPTLRIACI